MATTKMDDILKVIEGYYPLPQPTVIRNLSDLRLETQHNYFNQFIIGVISSTSGGFDATGEYENRMRQIFHLYLLP